MVNRIFVQGCLIFLKSAFHCATIKEVMPYSVEDNAHLKPFQNDKAFSIWSKRISWIASCACVCFWFVWFFCFLSFFSFFCLLFLLAKARELTCDVIQTDIFFTKAKRRLCNQINAGICLRCLQRSVNLADKREEARIRGSRNVQKKKKRFSKSSNCWKHRPDKERCTDRNKWYSEDDRFREYAAWGRIFHYRALNISRVSLAVTGWFSHPSLSTFNVLFKRQFSFP